MLYIILSAAIRHEEGVRSPWDWTWEPSVIAGVLAFTILYLWAVRRPGIRAARAQVALFLLGNALMLLALISPLEALADDYLFSAHMVQHLILITFVAPLWLAGVPDSLILSLKRFVAARQLARALASPGIAFLILNAVFWIWHWPTLYDLALANQELHIFQHLTFLASGVIGWWPVLAPAGLSRASEPVRLLYLFACCQPNVALGAIMVFSRDVLYQAYVDAPRIFDLLPYADQQVGGLIMWVPGNAVYLVVLSVIFIKWFSRGQSGGRTEIQ